MAGEIVRLRSVAPEIVESVLREFQDAFGAGTANASGGGVEVAHELLAATFGSERASAVLDRLAKAHATDAVLLPGRRRPAHAGQLPVR